MPRSDALRLKRGVRLRWVDFRAVHVFVSLGFPNLTCLSARLEYQVFTTRAPMLPPFIIEQIRQREEQERLRRDVERPRLQLPIDDFWPLPIVPEEDEDAADRGVAIFEL